MIRNRRLCRLGKQVWTGALDVLEVFVDNGLFAGNSSDRPFEKRLQLVCPSLAKMCTDEAQTTPGRIARPNTGIQIRRALNVCF